MGWTRVLGPAQRQCSSLLSRSSASPSRSFVPSSYPTDEMAASANAIICSLSDSSWRHELRNGNECLARERLQCATFVSAFCTVGKVDIIAPIW